MQEPGRPVLTAGERQAHDRANRSLPKTWRTAVCTATATTTHGTRAHHIVGTHIYDTVRAAATAPTTEHVRP